MCRHSIQIAYSPPPATLLECARAVQTAARKGDCGNSFPGHGTFQYGAEKGERKCACCQLVGDGGRFDASEYIDQRQYNIFKMKDLNAIRLTATTGSGAAAPGEPEEEKEAGSGLIIWSYTDRRNLSQSSIDGLTTKTVRQGACAKTTEWSAAYANLEKVLYKFNQMPDHDRFITWKGKVIYSYGYTNDNIYCIKWG